VTVAQLNLSPGATVAEALREFLRQKIELSKAELAKRQRYDDDRLHCAGQVFAYEAVLRETDHLPHPVSCSVSHDLLHDPRIAVE
jgi:hypothetical protein